MSYRSILGPGLFEEDSYTKDNYVSTDLSFFERYEIVPAKSQKLEGESLAWVRCMNSLTIGKNDAWFWIVVSHTLALSLWDHPLLVWRAKRYKYRKHELRYSDKLTSWCDLIAWVKTDRLWLAKNNLERQRCPWQMNDPQFDYVRKGRGATIYNNIDSALTSSHPLSYYDPDRCLYLSSSALLCVCTGFLHPFSVGGEPIYRLLWQLLYGTNITLVYGH